jgi:hypothetical protein
MICGPRNDGTGASVRKEGSLGFSLCLIPLFAVFLLVGCTLNGTPRRSLSELRTALLNHDADAALRYVDVDSVVDCMARDLFQKYETKTNSPLEALGIRAAREVARAAMPGIKALAKDQVTTAITSSDQWGYFDDIRRVSPWYFAINVDGDTALVEPRGQSNVRFRMVKTGDGYWRIVEINRKAKGLSAHGGVQREEEKDREKKK